MSANSSDAGVIRPNALSRELVSETTISKILDFMLDPNAPHSTASLTNGVSLIIELIRGLIYKKFTGGVYKVNLFIYIFNSFVGRFISFGAVAFCIGLFEKYAPFKTTFTWYWLIYGYIVWELAHFVYHYLGHKVRLFWCLHSTHHAPDSMNLSVTYAHFFLEAPYADVIRTSICILLGVHPALLFFIMVIDGTWGAFIHVGENIMKDGNDNRKIDMKEIRQIYQGRMIYNIQFDSIDIIFNIDNHI